MGAVGRPHPAPFRRTELDRAGSTARADGSMRVERSARRLLLLRAMNTEDTVLLAAMRRAPRGEPPVRPVRLQRLSGEAREALDEMMNNLQHSLRLLGMGQDSIRREVF